MNKNVEIVRRENYIEIYLWSHRNHADIFHYELGTKFEFNSSNEFIARKNGVIVKSFNTMYDQ